VSAETRLPAPMPAEVPETAAYWKATGEGTLLLQRCSGCSAVIWYPRSHCPECGGGALVGFAASGNGTVYSWTVVRRGTGDYADTSDYVLAYVELAEGPRVLTNVVDCAPPELRVGAPVAVEFHPTASSAALVRFHLAIDRIP